MEAVRIEPLTLHFFSDTCSKHFFASLYFASASLPVCPAQKLRAGQLETKLFARMAEALPKDGDALLFEEGLTPDGVRGLSDAVMQGRSGRAAVFAGTDAGGYAYAIGQVSGDLRGLTRELNACLNGRGGGKPFFVQGSVQTGRAEIEAFFAGR